MNIQIAKIKIVWNFKIFKIKPRIIRKEGKFQSVPISIVPLEFLNCRKRGGRGWVARAMKARAPTRRALLTVSWFTATLAADMFPFKMSSRAAARFNCKRVQPDDLRLFRYGVVPDTARYKSSVTVPNVTRNVTFSIETSGNTRSSAAFPLKIFRLHSSP